MVFFEFKTSRPPLFTHCPSFAAVRIRRCLCEASNSPRWRGAAEELGKPPQILRKQDFVPDAAQAPKPKPVEPENPFHMRKSYLNLLSLTAGLLEGFHIGQSTDTISHIFVEVAGDFTALRDHELGYRVWFLQTT